LQNVPKAQIILVGNKNDLKDSRVVDDNSVNELSSHYNYVSFIISAKTGENISKVFYYSISLLPIFEEFTGYKEDIIKQLEIENIEKPNYFETNSFSNGVCLETAKAKNLDKKEEENNNEISLKIADSSGVVEYHNFNKKKRCKC
jgi:hypothetical protein